jgi:alkanesulfonate monooxygenase SsuD/methylene tetrahydromethanopterin reductase-like flavin-dependent oxidoreductase (luciferase family)
MVMNAIVPVSPRLAMGSRNTLKLGFFGANVSSGKNATKVPERWQATWDDNVRLAELADAAGFEFFLPIGRWKGYGGETGYQETSLETITWAAAILARTERITVFGTVHVPLFHPVIAAKQMVTADQVGHGRFGLNIVCGWSEDEFAMFGIAGMGHTERYELGQEWLDAVRRMWTDPNDFDFHGKYFHLDGVRSKPKPYGGTLPAIMNAGSSAIGRGFALRNCDAFFTSVRASHFDEQTGLITPAIDQLSETLSDVRAKAAALGRQIGIFTNVNIICKPTQKEAMDYYRYVLEENADWDAIDGQITAGGTVKDLSSPEYLQRRQNHIRQFPLIGDPDRVADLLGVLSKVGFDGIGITTVNFIDDFALLRDAVLPRLEAAGLRAPAGH